jgi:hypothetical protein
VEHYALNFDKLQFPANLPRCRRGTYYFFNQGTLHLSAAGSSRDYMGFPGDGTSERYFTEYSDPVSMIGPNLSAYAEAYSDNAAFVTFSAILPSQTHVTDRGGDTYTLQGADLFSDGVRGTVVQRNPLVIKFEGQSQSGNQTRIISGMLSSAPAKVIKVTPNHKEVLLPDGKDSVDVTFTATTDPPDMPVEWSGDLGDDPDKQDNTLTTHYNSPGVKLVTADIKTGESTNAREPRQATPGTSATARLPAIQVHFQTASGGELPNPVRLAIPTHAHTDDRFQSFKATITPKEAAGAIHLEVSGGVRLRDVSQSNNVIRFEMAGQTESAAPADQWVEARDTANTGVERAPVEVVVPKFVGMPLDDGAAQPTQVVNQLLNVTTTPSASDVPRNRGLRATLYLKTLRVTVTDQFNHPIGDRQLYGGSAISELLAGDPAIKSINHTLQPDSTYPDPVSLFDAIPGAVPLASAGARAWPAAPHNPLPAIRPVTTIITIFVDSIQLDSVLTRVVAPAPPNAINITVTEHH